MLNNEMQHFVIEMCHLTILILLVSSFKSHFEAPTSFFWVGTKECALGLHSIEKNNLVGSLSLIPLNKPRESTHDYQCYFQCMDFNNIHNNTPFISDMKTHFLEKNSLGL
jgi:hypothetical protein